MSRHTVFFKIIGLLVALWLMAGSAHAEIYYLHNDHLGNPQAVTDENRNVVWQGEYSPFGELVNETGTLKQPHRFPGQHADPETGLYYNYFRDYDPSLGRYVQSDPIGLAGGINTFGYALQNPVMYIDPDGLNPYVYAAGRWVLKKVWDGCKWAYKKVWVGEKKKGDPKPSPNFEEPTNPPQNPPSPENLPEGHTVREGPPTEQYPNGYWRQYDKGGNPVDPSTGKTPGNVTRAESRARTHVPKPPQ